MAEHSPRDPRDPLDEEAAWAEIVAGYGEQPEFPTADERPTRTGPDKDDAGDEAGDDAADKGPAGTDTKGGSGAAGARPGSFIVFAPGVGPRDFDRVLYGFSARVQQKSFLGKFARGEGVQPFSQLYVTFVRRYLHADVEKAVKLLL